MNNEEKYVCFFIPLEIAAVSKLSSKSDESDSSGNVNVRRFLHFGGWISSSSSSSVSITTNLDGTCIFRKIDTVIDVEQCVTIQLNSDDFIYHGFLHFGGWISSSSSSSSVSITTNLDGTCIFRNIDTVIDVEQCVTIQLNSDDFIYHAVFSEHL